MWIEIVFGPLQGRNLYRREPQGSCGLKSNEIEHSYPDYSLYPQYDFALGWLTRGCPRCNHSFCITPVNDAIIEELRKIRVKDYHFAWDDPREDLEPNFLKIKESGLKNPNQIGVYVLTNFWSNIEQDLHRIYTLRSMGFMPFVMIFNKQLYVDSRGRWLPGVEKKFTREELTHFKMTQHMQRWCGNRKLIKVSPDFNDYEPYKNWLKKGMPVPDGTQISLELIS